jgi:tetratricopeptide (TPR) repeat protein
MAAARDRSSGGKSSSSDRKNGPDAGATPADSDTKMRDVVAAALRAVTQAPDDMAAWDRLEAVSIEHENLPAAADAYRKALRQQHPAPLLMTLGERAAHFHQEWLADRPASLVDILKRVLEIEPSADWALRRLIVVLTLQESWGELLAAYDRALSVITERGRRVQMLEEAAQVAKDFAGNADRAVGYLQQLFVLKPNDWQVAGALERLLERQERWTDLVALWRARLEAATPDETRSLRVRIATTALDRLNDPRAALEETRRLLTDVGYDGPAVALLERIMALASAGVELRLEALRLVEAQYDRDKRPDMALAAVRAGLSFATGRDLAALHRDAAARLSASGDRNAAAQHLAALLGLLPDDGEVQDQLNRLCATIGDYTAYAEGLASAAKSTTSSRRRVALVLEAGHVHERLLGDLPGAIAFYARVPSEPEAEAPEKLRSLRRLDELLEKAERASERADVLTVLADLTPRASERRQLLGALARVVAALGDVDRAARAWEKRLEMDAADREALDGLVDLLAGAERWQPLVAALRRRMGATADAHERRDDLERIARIQSKQLGDAAAAIESWNEHEKTFGASLTGIDALVELLTDTKRWPDLGGVLTETAERDRNRAAALATRLGETCRLHLRRPAEAAGWYRRALVADPAHAGAREGIMPLVGDTASRPVAVAALVAAAAATDDWRLTLQLLEPRLEVAGDAAAKVEVLRESARLYEARGEDRQAALTALCRALPLDVDDRALEGEALRLAGETGDFKALESAVSGAIARLAGGARRRTELLALRGDLCDSRLGDVTAALAAYREALEAEPGRLDLRRLVVRTAGRAGRWDEVARALLAADVPREVRAADLVPLAEGVADETAGFRELAAAVAGAVARASLVPTAACEVENRIASWYAERLRDEDAAEAALVRALAHVPDDLPTLRRLADLQRRAPGEKLYETLLRVAALAPNDLDALHEATEIARTVPLERGKALDTGGRLLDQAGRLLRLGARPDGTRMPDEAARLALDTLVAGYLASRAPEDCRRAISLQIDGAALPLGTDTTRALRRSAAALAEERLGDRALAIDIRRALVAAAPDDGETVEALAALYAAEDRLVDLAELRRHQLERAVDPARRLELRLEIERLGAVLEQRSDRVALLRANLAERPGHPATVDAIAAVLDAKRRHGELADVLADQAKRVEEQASPEAAANLWTRMARIAEDPLGDKRRAIHGHERTAALAPTSATLDALGRLCMEVGDAEAAARWLDRRLGISSGEDAPVIVLKLAQAYLASERRHRAIACLERVNEQHPASTPVRAMLADLYRTTSAWEPLAQLLTDATAHLQDRAELVATAREAHRLFRDEVGAPQRAVPALDRAVAIAPDETDLAMALGVSLTAAGRLDESQELLERLLSVTRRSPDRAALHLQLGRVARAQGQPAAALAQLEQAAAVDMGNPEILRLLGDTAREAGQVERAERAYRGLLMILRRGDATATAAAGGVSVVETLLALYELATERGETAQASDVLDSAFEAAAHDAREFDRLRQRLGARGELAALASALDKRAAAAKTREEQAAAYREIAEVRAQQGELPAAFEAQLMAVQAMPDETPLQERARTLAREAGLTERLLSALESVAERRRRRDDGPLVAKILLVAGDIVEKDLADPPRALRLYKRAADVGDQPAEAASALARVGVSCDPAERGRALERLARLAREASTPEAQSDALYRLAEAELAAADTREAGLATLTTAMDHSPNMERALGIVRDAVVPSEELHKVLPLYERLARASGDDRMLLDCLERRASAPDATTEHAREGYDLAVALGADDRAEALLGRIIELGRARSDGASEAGWGLIERAKRRRAAGDLDGAHRALADALEVGDTAAALPMLRELATETTREGGDQALGARVYETLRARTPTDPALWGTLLDIYARTGDAAGLARVAGETLQQLADPAQRNQVRMRCARFLLDRNGNDRTAMEMLRDALLDEPEHDQVAAMLTELYERLSEEGLLAELLDQRRHTLAERGDKDGVRDSALKLTRLISGERPDDAVGVLRWALEQLPGDGALIEAVLALLPADPNDARAKAIESVLAAQPNNNELRAVRESRYRAAQMWEPLALVLVESANQTGGKPADAAPKLREAASIYKNHLFDFNTAVDLLRKARALDPNNVEVMRELATSLVDLGEPQKALAETLTASRAPGLPRDVRAKLLRLRAELLIEHGQRDAAISVLLEALAYSTAEAKQEILATVDKLRATPAAPPPPPPAAAAAASAAPQAPLSPGDTDEIELLTENTQH